MCAKGEQTLLVDQSVENLLSYAAMQATLGPPDTVSDIDSSHLNPVTEVDNYLSSQSGFLNRQALKQNHRASTSQPPLKKAPLHRVVVPYVMNPFGNRRVKEMD